MCMVMIVIESVLIVILVNILIVVFFRNFKVKGKRLKENKCCYGDIDF